MRPGYLFFAIVVLLLMIDCLLSFHAERRFVDYTRDRQIMSVVVESFGLTDLAVASEARYTRHPAVSDQMVPFMDHPGAIEHFPTGSFWCPVQ